MPIPVIVSLPAPLLGRLILRVIVNAGVAFKLQGREDEYVDPFSKGSRQSPMIYPPEGSVVFRNMYMVEHSGIYVGGGRFVSKNNSGLVVEQTLDTYLGSASKLFVSAGDDLKPLGRREISNRAKAAVGTRSNHSINASKNHGAYGFILNNCHIFTSYCITGERNDDTGLSNLKPTAKQHTHFTKWIRWSFDR